MQALCEVCGLLLTDPESVARKMGPDCAARYGTQSAAAARVIAANTDATGKVTHPRLNRLTQLFHVAERAVSEGKGSVRAIRDANKYRAQIANFGTASIQWEGQHV